MAHRSQSSSLGDNPLHPNYLPPHYKEEYRLAIDALLEEDVQGYYEFLQSADVVGFLAQPEIEHIKATVQSPSQGSNVPELPYHEGALEEDGSSDTYWPVHSDIDAPGLDLGWPMHQHSFIGPTEVTTLVNPSDPDMPSIKEQARRLIKNAQQVVAVVMDMFTDVDIFADLLDAAARHVPVYILLDEQNAHHFVTMVTNCKVNLDMVHMMRVRTVAGVTYFCRTGKSFKGQVKDRFLLSDCRAVLSGNYSFMWSFEKLHRCIAHLFLGELVTTFDEEFRILFAQSQPLTSEHSLVPLSSSETSSTSSFYGNQFGLKRTQSLRNPRGLPRHPELPSYPFGDSDRNAGLHFRRDDLFRHSAMDPGAGITIGKFAASQQFRLQQSFLEQGRSMVTRQMEMSSSAYKRHSYAEGTQESYSSSRQYMKQRVMNNLDETEQHHHREQTQSSHYFQGESSGLGPGSGYRHYDRHSGRASQLPIDQHSDSGFPPPELEPPPHGDYGGNVFSSEDLRHTPGQSPGPGRYEGGPNHKRPTVGQPYACLSSPTQTHAPEKTVFQTPADLERSQDPTAKHGLRSWRIHSYLSNYEDAGEEGLPQPMGSDAFEDPPPPQQPTDLEASAPRFGTNEPPRVFRPDALRPRYGKPILPDSSRKDTASPTTVVEREAEREGERDRGGTREVGVDVEVREAADISFSRHDSFRTRINPLLQRSSRLRSSLIFSSSKLETHNSGLGLQPATEEDDESNPIRTSSIVAQILEKRRSMSREPFDWRRKAQEVEKENEKDKETLLKEESSIKEEPLETIKEALKNPPAAWEPPNVTTEPPKPEPKPTSSLNMNDPASRLQYFKDLAAKRKASKIGMEVSLKDSEPAPQNPDSSDTSTRAPKVPALEVTPPVMEPNKPVVATKPAGLTRKPSLTFTKPPVLSATQPKPAEITQAQREEFVSEPQRKDTVSEAPKKESSKTLKPFPSPKFFKRDTTLKPLKTPGSRRVVSCDEQTLTVDATDAEKSELKKSRSHSSSSMTKTESKEGLNKNLGSNTSLNTLGFGGDGKADGKPLDFLKKQTQRLKGFLGPKDKKTAGTTASVGEDKSMGTVQEESGSATKPSSLSAKDANTTAPPTLTTNHKAAAKASPSRYQTSSGSVLFSSNLRDDTKVILEQISANSQKNRLEREETSGQEKGSDRVDEKRLDSSSLKNRFLRPQTNPQEREGLLKRIESMRKEKKVYSRFEMGNSLG